MKKLLINFSILVILISSSTLSFAATGNTGAATVYKVTITKFEMYNGTSWVTVSSGNSQIIDIASANAGSVAGTFFGGLTVPDGNYTQLRATVSATFTVSGSVGSDGTPIYTTAALANGVCVSTVTAGNVAECTVAVPGGLPEPTPDVLPSTLIISGGVPSHKIRVNFDVSAAIQETDAEGIAPGVPVVTMTMIPL